MDSAEVLKWIYDYKLVAENKKNAHLIYKYKIEGEDLSSATIEEQKSKLRAIENREKKNPEQVVLDYEKIIIDLYEFDVHFSVVDLYMRYGLAMQLVEALVDLYINVSKHRSIPGQMLKFNSLQGLSDKMSLFFCVMNEIDMVKINNTFPDGYFISDIILYYPKLATSIMRIRSLKTEVNSLDLIGKTFVWMILFFELVKRRIGDEKGETTIDKVQARTKGYLVDIYDYIQTLPVKTLEGGLELVAGSEPKKCMMDLFYGFRHDFLSLVGLFEDKSQRLNSWLYLCPIMKPNKTPFHVYFVDEKRNVLFDFVRSTFGHYAVSYGTKSKDQMYVEFVSSEVDDRNKVIRGIATVIDNYVPEEILSEKSNERIMYVDFSYSFDGNRLVFADEEGEEIFNLNRVDEDNKNLSLLAQYSKELKEDFFYVNDLIREWGYAEISKGRRHFVFSFSNGNNKLCYRISTDADPRLRFIRVDYPTYLFQPEGEELHLVIEAIGYIPVSRLEQL